MCSRPVDRPIAGPVPGAAAPASDAQGAAQCTPQDDTWPARGSAPLAPLLPQTALTSADPLLIAGPTASGKSALALDIATWRAGHGHGQTHIINADSMQVYADLAVITARPSPDDLAAAPHALYGHIDAARPHSVAAWLTEVDRALHDARAAGAKPVMVGGTGLYLTSLTEGLSPVPEIPADVRARWRAAGEARPAADLYWELAARDPAMAAQLRPSDPQRILRALEVLEATGRSLKDWQAQPGRPLLAPGTWAGVVIAPERDALYTRCDARFDAMLAAGAMDEVAALMARVARGEVAGDAPAVRALGVAQLADVMAGRATLAAAREAAKTQTRRFAKRQLSWFRGRMADWVWIGGQ